TIQIHVIIVNDGSTDNSAIIAKQYAADFPMQITYLEQENAGLSAARNIGIEHAQAEYLAFMDSDDWVSEDYYEQLLIVMEQTKGGIVCSDIAYDYEKGKLNKKWRPHLRSQLTKTYIDPQDENDKTYAISIFPMAQNQRWRSA